MLNKRKKNIYIALGLAFSVIDIYFILYLVYAVFIGGTFFVIESIVSIGAVIGIPSLLGIFFISKAINKEKRRKFIKGTMMVLFILYLMLLFEVLFGGFRTLFHNQFIDWSTYMKYNANFIPFRTIGTYIKYYINNTINKGIVINNLLGNLLLFMPMGLFLPSLLKFMYKWKVFILTLCIMLLAVEMIQLILQLGTFDIDDIILNFIGAIIIYSFSKLKWIAGLLKKVYLLDEF
jgi:glycopeptide antibiotics resistance protein